MDKSVSEPETISQPITVQTVNQSVIERVNQSESVTIGQSVKQTIKQSIDLSVREHLSENKCMRIRRVHTKAGNSLKTKLLVPKCTRMHKND